MSREQSGAGAQAQSGRDLADTDDLVQNTLLRALDQVRSFEPRREGAFLSYLRRILLNQVKDEIRRLTRRPGQDELTEEQQAVVMRIGLGVTHEQVAEALGSPSMDASRILLSRALVRLTEAMDARR